MVEWKTLNSIVKSISTGLNPRQNFILNEENATLYYVTVKEITSNKVVFSDSTDRITEKAKLVINNRSKLNEGDILFSGIGTIGKVAYVDIPTNNWDCSESVFLIKPNDSVVKGKFLSYILSSDIAKNQYEKGAAGAIMKGVRKATLESLLIPIPSLSEQARIVGALDTFTVSIDNLKQQIAERRKQYEYYRDQLLDLKGKEGVEMKTLGDVGEICMCKRIMKDQTSDKGEIPFFKIGTFGGKADAYIARNLFEEYKNKFSYPKKGDILISAAGTIGRSVVFDGENAYFQDSNIVWIANDETVVSNRYLYYFYQIAAWKTDGGTIKRLYNYNLKNTEIPVPSLSEQSRIVSILDTFEASIANLEAQLELREKQYEYYRNKLLTFE